MNLLNEAMRYARQGICVIPVNGKKPVEPWKRYQVRRMTKPELVRLFDKHGQRITGIAILTGRGSRHWVCRDFDKAGAYENWAAEYPELAKILPTVRTGKGHHVYFRCIGLIKTRRLGDGEIRGEKSYTLLAPSLHPNGLRYTWVNPKGLWACHYGFYPEETGLNRPWLTPHVTQEVLGAVGLGQEGLKEGVGKGSNEGLEGLERLQELQFIQCNDVMTLERAVAIAMPKAHSMNHACLLTLQRCLLTMKAQGGLDKAVLKALPSLAFSEWYEQNAYLNPKQTAEEYHDEFIECGKHARVPYGAGILSAAWNLASRAEPDEAAKALAPQKQRLSLLCRELQRLQGDKPFFLSARNAAERLGVTPITISRWLAELEGLKIIKRIKKGGIEKMQASEFRYIRETPITLTTTDSEAVEAPPRPSILTKV